MRASRLITAVLLVAVIAGFLFWRQHAAIKPAGPRDRAVTVEFTTAHVGIAPHQIAAIGQIVSSHSVAIRPQVSGTLTRVLFREGQDVKAGDPLFLIDPASYQAAIAQAEAQVAKDRAAQLSAEAQEQRLLPLADKGYVTPQELLDAKAAAAQARASVQLSVAAAANARINLERTLIRSPISGRTGALAVKSGNLVNAGDATPLVTINQLQPVQAEFSIPQLQLADVQAAMSKGVVKIVATAQNGGDPLAEGRILFVDNTVDATTGTVKLKAEFDNRDSHLWPGTFATFTATLSMQPDAVLVPELAVQPGAKGPYVYLVGDDQKAMLHDVVVDRQVGSDVVIASGLKGGERLVARAPKDLTPGATVRAIDAAPAAQGGDKPHAAKAAGATGPKK